MSVISDLAAAHAELSSATDQTDHEGPLEDHLVERGWVPFPLSTDSIAKLEALAGFSFPPLLRSLFSTKNAMPSFDVDVFGLGSWCGSSALEKNAYIAKVREEYGWDLPKLVAISDNEDFFAVTEAGTVVQICGNEGNIETEHGGLEGWLQRYTKAVLAKAADPDADVNEDPEAEFS